MERGGGRNCDRLFRPKNPEFEDLVSEENRL